MRRRGRSPTSYRGTNTAPEDDLMDEDDQNELIETMQREVEAQMQQFQHYFTLIGFGAIAIALLDPFLCQEECAEQMVSCWTHSVFSAVVHGATVVLARNKSYVQDFHWFLTVFALVVLPIVFWMMDFFHDDIEHLHIGLSLCNMVTFAGCMLLRWDGKCTSISVNDLHKLKYEHKTL